MADTSQPASVWQRAARQRWPMAQVVGDGQFAMRAACCANGHVMLFHFAQEAPEAADRACGHAFCSMAHAAYKVQPVQESVCVRQFT